MQTIDAEPGPNLKEKEAWNVHFSDQVQGSYCKLEHEND